MSVLAAAATGAAQVHVDLADLSGYHYYTGATFSVFAEDGRGTIVDCGRGGRYDGVGRAFGRARPATGFSLDLRRLAALANGTAPSPVIVAPDVADPVLAAAIAALRASGEAVVIALPDEAAEGRRRLAAADGAWHVEEN